MGVQLNRILAWIVLLSWVLISCPSKADSLSNELPDIKESVKNFISSFSLKDTVENISPSGIIGLCIAAVVLAIIFRGLIFIVIMFCVLVMMFGSTEKVIDYVKENFDFSKNIDLGKDILKPQEKESDKKTSWS
ncbi:MAG: hypothetical protein PG981_000579 [Wolbachia endosymbiont of Ctenocephalides orientis wCori]|nr:MAG: hypothetical protein PG981_000579 [Wolbachia endosymbiont of Ctenocephalides orientis wCori]